MKSEQGRSPDHLDVIASMGVRATHYHLGRIRLIQVLVPLGAILVPVARRVREDLVYAPVIVLLVAATWAAATSRRTESLRLRQFGDRLKLGKRTVRRGDEGMWRWHGRAATLFLLDGNIRVSAESTSDIERMRSLLEAVLGEPLRYTRRGSPRTRAVCAIIALAGLLLLGVAITLDQSALAGLAGLCIIGGGACFGAFSGSIRVSKGA